MSTGRLPALAAAALGVAALAACGPLNQNAQSTLTLLALGVTHVDRGGVRYDVDLSWNAVPGATTYELDASNSSTPLQANGRTSFVDTLFAPSSAASSTAPSSGYYVRALDVNNGEKVRSIVVNVTTLTHDASWSAPGPLTIAGASGGNFGSPYIAASAQPTVAWPAVPGAGVYYVTVADEANPGTIDFAALASSTSLAIGTIPDAKATWPSNSGYGQVSAGFALKPKATYVVTVTALGTDNSDLGQVRAIDVGSSSAPTAVQLGS